MILVRSTGRPSGRKCHIGDHGYIEPSVSPACMLTRVATAHFGGQVRLQILIVEVKKELGSGALYWNTLGEAYHGILVLSCCSVR